MNLLIVNAGSSSLKLRVLDDADQVVDEKNVADWDGDPDPLDSLLGKAAAVVHRLSSTPASGANTAGAAISTITGKQIS